MEKSLSRRSMLALSGAIGGMTMLNIAPARATEVGAAAEETAHVDESYFNQFSGETNFAPTEPGDSSGDGGDGAAAIAGLITFDQFMSRYNNQFVHMDNYAGAQCWDLWEAYCQYVIGVRWISTQYSAHPGYAIALWDGYYQNGADRFFDRVSAGSTPRKGDVAFWHFGSSTARLSHVAIVINDSGNYLNTFTQNTPEGHPSKAALISKSGLAGYFRPKTTSTGSPSIRSAGDLLAVDSSGMLWNYPSRGNGSLGTRFAIGSQWGGMLTGWTVDWNGDGVLDILAQWNNGDLRYYPGKRGGGFNPWQRLGSGFTNVQISPARFRTSDSRPGVITKYGNGDLFYFPNTNGGISSTTRFQIGHSWGSLDINAFDFNGDGKTDVLALNGSNDLIAYWGNGTGSFSGNERVGNGWVFKGIAPNRGFTGSGSRGVFGQKSTGELYYYPISGDRFSSASQQIGHGWGGYRLFNTQRM